MLRLNTWDFDESLVYAGKGAERNNILIDCFLEEEKENKMFYEFNKLEPKDFKVKVDSILNLKLATYDNYIKNHPKVTDGFKEIFKVSLTYPTYNKIERYPIKYAYHSNTNCFPETDENFYDYRNEINYNDEFLSSHHNYNKFLRYNLSNLSLKTHDNHDANACYDRKSLCYNLDRLVLIDSLVTNNEIKEDLLHYYTLNFLNRNKIIKSNSSIIDYYTSISNNNEGKDKIRRYAIALNNLKAGSEFPVTKLIATNNPETSAGNIINSPTVICFWSQTYYDHFKESQHKINELSNKYPEVKFVIINIDNYELDTVLKALKRNRFSLENQYQFKNPEKSKEDLAIYPMTKAFIVDKNKKIVNSKANIFSKNFEEQLLGLINR